MRISEIYVRLPGPKRQRGILALATITISGAIKVRDITILRRMDGSLFIATPTIRTNGQPQQVGRKTFFDESGTPYFYRELVSIQDTQARRYVESVVLTAYQSMIARGLSEVLFDIPAPSPSAVKVG